MSSELVILSSHLVLSRPLLLLRSMCPSIRVFSNESALCVRWPKYWSFSFSVSPSNEYSGLVSFRIDWFDLLVVQGTETAFCHLVCSVIICYITEEGTLKWAVLVRL